MVSEASLVQRMEEALGIEEGYPKVILTPLLASCSPEEIAEALPRAGEHLWILRDHLAERLGRGSNDFQEMFFFEVAAAGPSRHAALAAIGRIVGGGNRLSDEIIRNHIASDDRDHRCGAVHASEREQLALLEERFEAEANEDVKALIAERGKSLAREKGAPPSSFLEGAERIAQQARLFFDCRARWVNWDDLAEVLSEEVKILHAAIDPLLNSNAGEPGEQGFLSGGPGIRYIHSHDLWTAADDLVSTERYQELEAFLGTLTAARAPRGMSLPQLSWSDGTELSAKALQIRLALPDGGGWSFRKSIAEAIDRGLDATSTDALLAWWLDDKKRQKKVVCPGTDEAIDRLIEREGLKKTLKRPNLEAQAVSDRGTQLFYLAMQETKGPSKRNDLRNVLRHRGGLLDALVRTPPAFLGEAQWIDHLHDVVEGWLRAQTALWYPDLRFWLKQPLLRQVCDGLVFLSPEGPVIFRNETSFSEPSIDGNAHLTVAHQIQMGDTPWPEGTPEWQRNRPAYTEVDLPELGDESVEIPFKIWAKRTKTLGYSGVPDTGTGGVCKTFREDMVALHHNGHGGGYGGQVPQKIRRIEFSFKKNKAVVSEAIWDVRRILGVDPM